MKFCNMLLNRISKGKTPLAHIVIGRANNAVCLPTCLKVGYLQKSISYKVSFEFLLKSLYNYFRLGFIVFLNTGSF